MRISAELIEAYPHYISSLIIGIIVIRADQSPGAHLYVLAVGEAKSCCVVCKV